MNTKNWQSQISVKDSSQGNFGQKVPKNESFTGKMLNFFLEWNKIDSYSSRLFLY